MLYLRRLDEFKKIVDIFSVKSCAHIKTNKYLQNLQGLVNSFKIWQKFYCREQIAFDEKNHNNNNLFGGNWTESRDHDFLQ